MGGSAPKSETRLQPILSGGQQDILRGLEQFVGGQIGRSAPRIRSQITPPASGLQQSAFDLASGIVQGSAGGFARQGAADALLSGLPAFQVDPAAREQFFQEAFLTPATQDFQRNILPAISESFGARGLGRSGDLLRAQAQAGTDLGTQLAAQRAGLIRQDELSERQARENALNRVLPAIEASRSESLLPLDVGLQVGAVQRGINAQTNLDSLFREFQQNPVYNPALGLAPLALGSRAFQPVVETSAGSPGVGGAIGTVVGGLAGSLLGPIGTAGGAALGGAVGGLF